MKDNIPAHACIRIAMSGTVQSAINFSPIGEKCPSCGVLILEKYAIWPEAPETTEQPSNAGADKGANNP